MLCCMTAACTVKAVASTPPCFPSRGFLRSFRDRWGNTLVSESQQLCRSASEHPHLHASVPSSDWSSHWSSWCLEAELQLSLNLRGVPQQRTWIHADHQNQEEPPQTGSEPESGSFQIHPTEDHLIPPVSALKTHLRDLDPERETGSVLFRLT